MNANFSSASTLNYFIPYYYLDVSRVASAFSSLGKGYYEFTFSCLEDVKRVRSVPSWNLNPGITQSSTSA